MVVLGRLPGHYRSTNREHGRTPYPDMQHSQELCAMKSMSFPNRITEAQCHRATFPELPSSNGHLRLKPCLLLVPTDGFLVSEDRHKAWPPASSDGKEGNRVPGLGDKVQDNDKF